RRKVREIWSASPTPPHPDCPQSDITSTNAWAGGVFRGGRRIFEGDGFAGWARPTLRRRLRGSPSCGHRATPFEEPLGVMAGDESPIERTQGRTLGAAAVGYERTAG